MVLHTSVPFGVEHIDKTVDQMEPLPMDALRRSFPQLPPPKSVKCHKWRYSQVRPFQSILSCKQSHGVTSFSQKEVQEMAMLLVHGSLLAKISSYITTVYG